jgi:hypothetical protein
VTRGEATLETTRMKIPKPGYTAEFKTLAVQRVARRAGG